MRGPFGMHSCTRHLLSKSIDGRTTARKYLFHVEYEPVRDFDPRFFYYDHYQMITQESVSAY